MNIQIASCIRDRITEYKMMMEVVTINPAEDIIFNRALSVVIEDLENLLLDCDQAVQYNIPLIRTLHAVN